jgi:hydroxymethylpyrimidine pyrophosphatase-like HAD family hydrolase
MDKKPICVDLDGTLIRNDVTIRAFRAYLAGSVWSVFSVVFWLIKGRAYLKKQLASSVNLDPSLLDYNNDFLQFIIDKKKEGHKIFLATACDKIYADQIAEFLSIRLLSKPIASKDFLVVSEPKVHSSASENQNIGSTQKIPDGEKFREQSIFDGVFASDGVTNLRAEAKAQALVTAFGKSGFIYAGNSEDDLKVWNKSAEYILVSPSKRVLRRMRGQKYLLFK